MSSSSRLSSQERRSAILETAIQLFADRGFRGVTTRELAAAIGVSEPILYQHFPSKKDLYNAIIEHTMDEGYYEALNGLKRLATTQNDEEFFRHLASAMIHWYQTRPQELRIKLFSALEGHELTDQFTEKAGRPFVEVVVGYLQRRMAEGAFVAMHPPAMALAYCGMVQQFCMATILFKSKVFQIDQETMVDHIVKIFLNGIRNSHS